LSFVMQNQRLETWLGTKTMSARGKGLNTFSGEAGQ
jgi:hypothetical protein